jgi:PAS domain S-box-containing protein
VKLEVLNFAFNAWGDDQFAGAVNETRFLRVNYCAILNSVQDAIEVVDDKGIIKYVNPAFTRVTGIPENKRLNRSIFEVSPHGALAQSLIQQKPVTGYRTYVGGSDADVISNASPIIVDGELLGAVVVFQPVGDILKVDG